MIVVLTAAVVGLVAGVIAGGSLRNFERVHVYWWGAAVGGLVLQLVPFDRWLSDDVAVAALVGSYAPLIAFAWVNRRLPAAPLLFLGLTLNMTVIALNGGMPVSEAAIRAAGGSSGVPPSAIDDSVEATMRPDAFTRVHGCPDSRITGSSTSSRRATYRSVPTSPAISSSTRTGVVIVTV